MENFLLQLNVLKDKFDMRLRETLAYYRSSILYDCMEYALFSGGKRIRPLFYIEALKAFDTAPTKTDYAVASAIEFLHTYTLVHDDMPCMDNDDFRRGQPTVHKKFNEVTALLAGDALQAAAFEILAKAAFEDANYTKALKEFSYYAGVMGVIDGQALELRFPNNIKENIFEIYIKKTSALLTAPLVMAAIVAKKDDEFICKIKEFGTSFGMAFQLSDDLLDSEKDKEISFVTCFGKEKTLTQLEIYSQKSCNLASEIFGKNGFFVDISRYVAERKN